MIDASAVTTHPALAHANTLLKADRYEEAAQALIGFVRQNPNNPTAHAQLGFAAMRLGALMQAETFLRRALVLGSRDFDLRRNLASVLSQQERPALALPMFEELAKESSDVGLRAITANLIEKTGDNERARAIYRQLTEDHPNNPQAWVSYGHSLRAAGMVEEAVAAYRSAIAIADDFGDAWWGLASIRSKVFDDSDIAALREAISIAVDSRNLPSLHFALARALHERKEHAEAFRHYEIGNRLRAQSLGYKARELSDEVDEVVAHADAQFVKRLDRPAVGDAQPVFIISLPRSGSTLLEQMLGSHSQVEPVGELPYIPAILRSLMEMATRRGKVTVLQAIASIDDRMAAAMGQDYLQRARLHRKTDAPYFLDKLPHNWSNVLFIKRILPQARFIDIRRPAMDCCFSNFTQSFTSAHASSFTLHDMGQSYVDNVRMMDHLDAVAPGLVHHISYSELVDDARPILEATLAYLGLEWDEAVLEFHRNERVVRTPSSEQVRRPLNRDGMEVWRPYSEWLSPLREVLGPLADA